MMEKNKRVYVVNSDTWLPENAIEFMNFWIDKLYQVPEEYLESAVVEFSAYDDYGASVWDCEMYYYRPETDSEKITKCLQDRSRKDKVKQNELEQLRHLQEKYKDE